MTEQPPEVSPAGAQPGAQSAAIRTPDQRIRVFVSSTLQELAEERRAARAAVERLRLTPVMFETGARPHPPRELYRAYLAQSDVFVGIYWQRYGWVAPGEVVSGLEDEYLLSAARPKLIYVKLPAPEREPQLAELLARIQQDDSASYKPFDTAAELTELVADDLAVLLTERFEARSADPPGLRRARLPVPPTALVGRAVELAALTALLRQPESRLVTLIGPGGIGKTRLALAAAQRLLAEEADGVWFVDLAPVSDPAMVPAAIAAALGIRIEGTQPALDVLADRLQGRQVLLVLDNFEHLLAAAPDVAGLLAGSSVLRVLVTSRTALQLRGEHELLLSALAVPELGVPAGLADPDRRQQQLSVVAESAAVRLFVARAADVRTGFELTSDNAEDVAEICRRLEGIPLALELAAAQLRLLTPAGLRDRLGDWLDLRAGPVDLPRRQRTLHATVEWSYSLLSPAERVLFSRLSVFASGWSLAAAEVVGADPGGAEPDVLQTMSSLVAQSIVTVEERTEVEPRFRMLDTVRRYARERLAESGEQDATMRRLVGYLRTFSEDNGRALESRGNRAAVARVDAIADDLRAAIRWAIDVNDAQDAIRLAAPLSTYWWMRGRLSEMLDLAEATAALPSAAGLPSDAQVLLLWARGIIRVALGHGAQAVPLLRRLVATASELGDDRLHAHALTSLALALPASSLDEVRRLLDEALELVRDSGDPWAVAFVLSPRGQLALRDGDVAAATAMHSEALAKAELIDNDHLRAQALDQLGLDALQAGDLAGARSRLAASAVVHRRLLDQEGAAYCLAGFAAVALVQGRPGVAARLTGASDRAREATGLAVWPLLRPLADQLAEAVRAAAGAEQYQRERELAAGLRLADALDYALRATDPLGATGEPEATGGAEVTGGSGPAPAEAGRPAEASVASAAVLPTNQGRAVHGALPPPASSGTP